MRPVLIFTILISIAFYSCSDIEVNTNEKIHFSISPFIKQLAKELETKNVQLLKKANLNGETDSSLVQELNWEEELSIFEEAEINKSAYIGKFTIDSLFIDSGELEINYTTDDPKIRIKELKLLQNNAGKLERIEIRFLTNNSLYKSEQYLELLPKEGFHLNGTQKIMLFEADSFSLRGDFIYP